MLCTQAMCESAQELDCMQARTLLAESAWGQLIIGEDLAQSLMTLRADLEASSEMLLSDLAKTFDIQPNNPASCQAHAILQRYQQATSLKVNLSLMQLQAAWDNLEVFLWSRLQEINSQTESRDLIEELTRRLSAHASMVRELVRVPELAEEEVSHRVLVGLATDQPLEANFSPSLLEGLAERLGLAPPVVPNPLALAKARVSQQWATTLREGIIRDTSLEQFAHAMWPPGLHLDYDMDFQTRRFDDIPPSLTTPLPPDPAGDTHQPERPEIPEKPGSSKSEEGLWGRGWAPTKPDSSGPSREGEMIPKVPTSEMVATWSKLGEQGEEDPDKTITEPDPVEVAAVVILDDEDTDLPIDIPPAASTPKREPGLSQKQPLEERGPHTSPPKKQTAVQKERNPSPREASLPKGVTEADILSKQYDVFTSDYDWVHSMRCSLLGLETGTIPARMDIDTSEHFLPHTAASESDLPDVITDHWVPILQKEGLLVECPQKQFTAAADWVPLYTPEGLKRYLPMALSAFTSTGAPRLTAVVPLECRMGTDKEFLLSNFHRHECLVRQSLLIDGKHRQLAFCPYCGVINENSDTAISHVRKHLSLHLICGGCYCKSFLSGPALHRHMRTACPSVTAIRGHSRASRR